MYLRLNKDYNDCALLISCMDSVTRIYFKLKLGHFINHSKAHDFGIKKRKINKKLLKYMKFLNIL